MKELTHYSRGINFFSTLKLSQKHSTRVSTLAVAMLALYKEFISSSLAGLLPHFVWQPNYSLST
jgi:hypothetical protein